VEAAPADVAMATLTLVSLNNKPFELLSVGSPEMGIQWSIGSISEDTNRIELHFSGIGSFVHKLAGDTLGIRVMGNPSI
jgi:hypothetical protein